MTLTSLALVRSLQIEDQVTVTFSSNVFGPSQVIDPSYRSKAQNFKIVTAKYAILPYPTNLER